MVFAEKIDASSNGRFVKSVTLDTHYLVATKFDSFKAKKAARLGTTVISEQDLLGYLGSGVFPETALPEKPVHQNHFPEIEWSKIYDPARTYLLTYIDALGNGSIRRIVATAEGNTVGNPSVRWLAAYDGEGFKTWRFDRIKELEIIE